MICNMMGTLDIKHNNQIIHHEDCSYDPSYSNLISRQRMGSPKILVDNYKGLLKRKNGTDYKLEINENGGQWITPDDSHADIQRFSTTKEENEMHDRYGHISYDTLSILPEFPKIKEKPRCEACEKGKATKPRARNQKGSQIRTT